MHRYYHFLGTLSSTLFILSLLGLYLQLATIVKRRAEFAAQGDLRPGRATESLTINRLLSSYFAFYSVFLYGLILPEFDHYIVYSRLIAVLLALTIIYEAMIDRRTRASVLAFIGTSLSLLIPLAVAFLEIKSPHVRAFSQLLLISVAIMLAQGYVLQIRYVLRHRSVGAICKQTHQLYLIKDLVTVLFGISMGLHDGWPLVFMCSTSALCQTSMLLTLRSLPAASSTASPSHLRSVAVAPADAGNKAGPV